MKASTCIRKYASFVSAHPIPFIIVPILIASTASYFCGWFDSRKYEHATQLYIPKDARSYGEIKSLLYAFGFNETDFHPHGGHAQYRHTMFVSVMAVAKDGRDLMTESSMKEITDMFRFVSHLKLEVENGTLGYNDLCLSTENTCAVTNGHVAMMNLAIQGRFNLTYPKVMTPHGKVYIGEVVGGVTLENGIIVSAKAVRLLYYLRYIRQEDKRAVDRFYSEIEHNIADRSENEMGQVEFSCLWTNSLVEGLNLAARETMQRFLVSFGILVVFCCLATISCTPNQVNASLVRTNCL